MKNKKGGIYRLIAGIIVLGIIGGVTAVVVLSTSKKYVLEKSFRKLTASNLEMQMSVNDGNEFDVLYQVDEAFSAESERFQGISDIKYVSTDTKTYVSYKDIDKEVVIDEKIEWVEASKTEKEYPYSNKIYKAVVSSQKSSPRGILRTLIDNQDKFEFSGKSGNFFMYKADVNELRKELAKQLGTNINRKIKGEAEITVNKWNKQINEVKITIEQSNKEYNAELTSVKSTKEKVTEPETNKIRYDSFIKKSRVLVGDIDAPVSTYMFYDPVNYYIIRYIHVNYKDFVRTSIDSGKSLLHIGPSFSQYESRNADRIYHAYLCAYEQGNEYEYYFEMLKEVEKNIPEDRRYSYNYDQRFEDSFYVSIIRKRNIDIDRDTFRNCLESNKYINKIASLEDIGIEIADERVYSIYTSFIIDKNGGKQYASYFSSQDGLSSLNRSVDSAYNQ